jgi:hypothetical protein
MDLRPKVASWFRPVVVVMTLVCWREPQPAASQRQVPSNLLLERARIEKKGSDFW